MLPGESHLDPSADRRAPRRRSDGRAPGPDAGDPESDVALDDDLDDGDEYQFIVRPPWRAWLRSWTRYLINVTGAAGITIATAGHARLRAPFDVRFTTLPMPLRGAGEGLAGFRIVQVTDLHAGGVPVEYLRGVIDRVNAMPADLVAVTGDLVSSDLRYVEPACDVLAALRHPAVVTFGNHDYSESERAYASAEVAEALEAALLQRGLRVLRNRSIAIERDGARLWIAGLEDLWTTRFSAEAALAGIPAGEPVVALSHNPDTGPRLARHGGVQWVLAGHTHGGQIRLPWLRPLMLPVRNKRFASGLFTLANGTRMYVSRGVGCRVPVRFRCPPEVTTFVVERAPAEP